MKIEIGLEAVEQAIFNQRVAARIEEATKWAIWKNGVEVIGIMEHPLKKYIDEIIEEEK
jgi:hypothetical protein